MAITKEEIQGTKILNEIESSNLVRTEYDTNKKDDWRIQKWYKI